MELNKCKRCGAFFVSDGNVCPNGEPKDTAEIFKLKNYLAENNYDGSIESLSCATGISVRNLGRFLENKEISKLENFNTKNIKIDL